MSTMMIPRWFIKARCLPSGRRLEKLEKFVVPKVERIVSQQLSTPFLKSKFDNSEYRFWCAEETDNKLLIECRACGLLLIAGEEDRIQHQKDKGCTKKLVAAYKLLLRDKKCVICDKVTSNVKWGVPLCSMECMNLWCHMESKPNALDAALNLVGNV